MATLIGDLVGSRDSPNRRGLQRSLSTVLKTVNGLTHPAQPLEPTVGDEFQGVFPTVNAAVLASLLLRLELLKEEVADSRYGIGFGSVTVFERRRSPKSQDGPGWWSARAAIDRAKKLASSPRTAFVRTCFELPQGDTGETGVSPSGAAGLDAFLICRDAIIDQMNPRTRRLLLGMMLNRSQAQLAADEGVSQGAVSQSLTNSRAFAILAAQQRIEEPSA